MHTLYKHIKNKVVCSKTDTQQHNQVGSVRKKNAIIFSSHQIFLKPCTQGEKDRHKCTCTNTCFQNIMLHHLYTCPMKLHTKHSLNKTKNWSTTTQMETTRLKTMSFCWPHSLCKWNGPMAIILLSNYTNEDREKFISFSASFTLSMIWSTVAVALMLCSLLSIPDA